MNLVGWMLETALGSRAKAPLSVGLFLRDREISVPGYERIPVPRWRLTDRSASTSVTFGPYPEGTRYDRYVLFAGTDPVDEFPEESEVALPRGFVWDWKPELILGS